MTGIAVSEGRLVDIVLDEASVRPVSEEVAAEQRMAAHDLLLDNAFRPLAGEEAGSGRYALTLSLAEGRLVMVIRDAEGQAEGAGGPTLTHALSLTPLARVMRDYLAVFESYTRAAQTMSPAQLEAIDMGRRGAHDAGAELLAERLKDKVAMDHATARRLFTLVCTLVWRGSLRG